MSEMMQDTPMLSRSLLALTFIVSGASFVSTGARAHSVFVTPAPQVHITAGRQSFGGLHGRMRLGYGRPGTRTVINGQIVFVGGYNPDVAEHEAPAGPLLDAPVPSDADRYRASTGATLPPEHGMIVLPPATPRGDVTYLWSTSDGN